jgi:hypothetical protein
VVHPFTGCSSIGNPFLLWSSCSVGAACVGVALTRLATPTLAVLVGGGCASTDPRPSAGTNPVAAAAPEINDIGYYAPSGDLVFYDGDVGYFNGIVRIGRLDAEHMSVIERQPDGFELTIERG